MSYRLKLLISLLFILIFISLIYFANPFYFQTDPGPLTYFYYADWLTKGFLPYRDFDFEYPPFALVFFLIGRFFTLDPEIYRQIFWILLGLLGFLGLWAIIDLGLASLIYTFLFLALGPIIAFRFDLIPAILSLLVLSAWKEKRKNFALFLLGVATATKLYPILILPFLLIYSLKERKSLFTPFCFFLFGLILPLIPLLSSLSSLGNFITYHTSRGIQVESLWANILILSHLIFKTPLTLVSEAGAIGLFPSPEILIIFSIILFLGIYFWLVYRYSQLTPKSETKKGEWLFLFSFLAILLFILTNRVFSPQFIIWLLPLIPLLSLHFSVLFLFILAAILTQILYPFAYYDFLAFAPWAVSLITIRNLLLIYLFIILVFSKKIFSLSE